MTQAFYRLAALVTLVALVAAPVRAAMELDPPALYAQMKAAYDKAAAGNWDFADQRLYLSAILAAGRAYALQAPNDPAYGELATLTVQTGTGLHYNPLTNHDGAVWYVREAANWAIKNSSDPSVVKNAQDLLARANAEGDPEALARFADQDALANAAAYRGDVEANLEVVEADWRGWVLTGDDSWRTLAFLRAANPDFPIAHLPTTWGPEFLRAAEASNDPNAAAVVARVRNLATPLVIASVTSMPHDVYLTTLAPADEYFGKMGYSVLGMENELKRINTYLDYRYGDREANAAVLVAEAVDDMHRIYPRDRDMPKLLYACMTTLDRMDASSAKESAERMRSILTVEYQDSPEARKVLMPQ
jgi:hypothetical protein